MPTWLIQIYEMADEAAQQSAARLLADIPGLTIDAPSCDRGSYLVVDFGDATEAMAVYELVMIADPNAELIHSTRSPAEAQAVRNRVVDVAPASDGDLLDA